MTKRETTIICTLAFVDMMITFGTETRAVNGVFGCLGLRYVQNTTVQSSRESVQFITYRLICNTAS